MTNINKFQDLVLKTRKIRGLKTNLYKAEGMRPIIDQGSKFIAGYSDDSESFYEDDLPVVVFGDHTLAVKYIDFPFCVGADGTQILKPNKDIVSAKFLYYSILNQNIKSLGYSRHFKVLKECIFRIPPLDTQKCIVVRLDAADQLRRKRKQAIALLDDYLKAVFLEMFGDPVVNPKGWEVKTLGDLARKITDGTHKTPEYLADGVKFISAKNIKGERIDWSDIKHISREEHSSIYKRCNAEQGDILLTKSGSLGMAALVDVDFEFSVFESLALIKVDHDILDSVYLREYLNLEAVKRFYLERTKGVGVKHLHLIDIKSIPVLMPSLDMQKQFVAVVKKSEQLKSVMNTQSDELENNFNALMQGSFNNKE